MVAQVPTVLSVPNPAGNPRAAGLYAEANAFVFSDPVSLKALGERWQGSFTPRVGEQGFLASTNYSIVYRAGAAQYALWQQQRVMMTASRDTVEFMRITKAREDLPLGRTYDLKMAAEGNRRTGLTVSHQWVLAESESFSWYLGVGGKGWYADQAQSGLVLGRARATGEKAYDFNLTVDYRYTKNLLYDLPVPASRGLGAGGALGTFLQWQSWSIEAAVEDIGARTWWKGMPFTSADAKSKRQHYDSNGYLQFDPTIEGIEGEKDWVQRTPMAWMVRGGWGRGPWRLASRVERFSNLLFYAWEGSFQLAEATKVGVAYEPRTRSWAFGWSGKQARAGVASQSLNFSRSRSIGLTLGWAWGSAASW